MALAFLFPGQGSQAPGMGADVFDDFPDLVTAADEILGYPVRGLCLAGGDRLRRTEYAQPALYVVNALTFLSRRDRYPAPSFLAGHSLGEWSALFAAGCVDFATGLELVRRRGELMGRATGGAMMAVLGVPLPRLLGLIERAGIEGIDVANHNTPDQVVLAGPQEATRAAADVLAAEGIGKCVPLNVSVAAHSRYLAGAAREFRELLREVRFAEPSVPVIANVTGEPHTTATLADRLSEHLCRPVRWWDTLCLLASRGVDTMVELGPGEVLSKIWNRSREHLPRPAAAPVRGTAAQSRVAPRVDPGGLGSGEFRRVYRTRYAYLAGALGHGVSGPELVVRLARAGLLGFLGTAGRSMAEAADDLSAIVRAVGAGGSFGIGLPAELGRPELVRDVVELGLRQGVRYAETSGRLGVLPAYLRWRFVGAGRDGSGAPVAARHLVVRVSRVDLAAEFLRPPPSGVVDALCARGELTRTEAEVARTLPVSQDVAVDPGACDVDSPTSTAALLPAVLALRDEVVSRYGYRHPPRVGAAGDLGTPAAVAAAFLVGADFVLTGWVNQCSPQARTSAAVKELLSTIDTGDTGYAPAGELFELGGRGPVVRRGTLFAARAETLYQAYRSHTGLDQLDGRTRRGFEENLFRRPLDEVWACMRHGLATGQPAEVSRAERDPKHRMALVFRWYIDRATRLAIDGVPDERLNYRVPCDPAVGAFNRAVAGTPLADWRCRDVEVIAEMLLRGAADLLGDRLRVLATLPGAQE